MKKQIQMLLGILVLVAGATASAEVKCDASRLPPGTFAKLVQNFDSTCTLTSFGVVAKGDLHLVSADADLLCSLFGFGRNAATSDVDNLPYSPGPAVQYKIVELALNSDRMRIGIKAIRATGKYAAQVTCRPTTINSRYIVD